MVDQSVLVLMTLSDVERWKASSSRRISVIKLLLFDLERPYLAILTRDAFLRYFHAPRTKGAGPQRSTDFGTSHMRVQNMRNNKQIPPGDQTRYVIDHSPAQHFVDTNAEARCVRCS